MTDDFEFEQERHRRRVRLMQLQGETNRLETRAMILIPLAGILAIIALAFSL